MIPCKRCKTPYTPAADHTGHCSDFCANADEQRLQKAMATNPGALLVVAGLMPRCDALALDGSPAWTWPTLCTAFGADPIQLASLLKPRAGQSQAAESVYTVHRSPLTPMPPPEHDYLDDYGRPCWRLETIAENLPEFLIEIGHNPAYLQRIGQKLPGYARIVTRQHHQETEQ